MFVRTANKFIKKTYQGTNDPAELLDNLKTREKHVIIYRDKDPINVALTTLMPVFYAVLLAMLFTVFSIRQPNPQAYGGKVVLSDFIRPGAILASEDTLTQSRDYNLTFPVAGDSTIMMAWDYADEDWDSIAILVDGKPMGDDVRLFHKPKVLRVPKGADVKIIGTFDGGGGITYSVYFPEIKKTIVNGLSTGEMNTYSLNVAR